MSESLSVMLTSTQRDAARGMAAGAIATARGCLREARAWREQSAVEQLERAASSGRTVRDVSGSWLRLAASYRRDAQHYAQLAATGLAPVGSSWDAATWGLDQSLTPICPDPRAAHV